MKKSATLRDVGEDALIKQLIADAPLGADVVAGAVAGGAFSDSRDDGHQ